MELERPQTTPIEPATLAHQIVQSIIGDIDYSGTARDDEVFWQIQAIHEENGLPYDLTPDEIYNLYASNYGGSYE